MGGKSISTSATRIEALTIQSSTYGATIPWLRGVQRVAGNLIWYGGFKSIPQTKKTGGKGGGGSSTTTTTYTYTASLMMALCHGSITSIPTVWKGKGTTTLSALGLTQINGAIGQAAWSGLSSFGSQNIGYSGLAAVAGANYSLGSGANVENHSFEVVHASAYAISGGIPDVDPSVAMADLLTDTSEGAALSSSVLATWTDWSNWCVASGLLVSPLLTEQAQAIDVLRVAAQLTNTGMVWSDGKLKMVPYADQSVTGNGRTYSPSNTPVYQLDDTCYTPAQGQEPVRVSMKTPSDLFNQVKVEYKDRANGYQVAIAEAKDLTDISVNGLRTMATVTAHWITTAAVARQVAELLKQRALLVTSTYAFELPWHYALIEPMDLLTLSDSVLGMVNVPVRVTSVTENDDGTLSITAEDFPAGSANAPLYAAQVPAGFAGNKYASPGSVNQVVVFEGPGALTGKQLQVWVAARGDGANWGGCTVWVSLDGTTYTALGRIEGGSRCGQLTGAISAGVMPVQIGAAQQLVTVSAADATALNSLCYVGPVTGATTPELLAYTSASLTGAGAYNLGSLVRAAYGTTGTAHASGAPFAFIDQSIAKSAAIDPSYIGSTVYVKCTSFNIFGLSEESLASVSATAYAITGAVLGGTSTGVSIGLSTDTLVLPADNSGNVTSFSLAATTATVILNGADDTAAWTFSGTPSSGLTFTRVGAVFTITAFSNLYDTATLNITATKTGQPSLTKTLYLSKAKSGAAGAAGGTGATGGTGANGTRTADAKVYSNQVLTGSGAPSISGTSTYTWSSGTLGTAPTGWNLTPPTPSAGYSVYVAVVRLSNTNTTTSDSVNWVGSSVSVYSSASLQGGSARTAYAKSTTNPLASTPTSVTTSGASSYPATNAWGGGEVWGASPAVLSAGEYQFQVDGIYDPASTNTTWQGPPYQSALKVGSLSAISANLGTITAGSISSVTVTGGLIQTAASGQRIALNESSGNTIRVYGDVGAGNEVIAEIGKTSSGVYGTSSNIASFGGSGGATVALYAHASYIGILAAADGSSAGSSALRALATAGVGVYTTATSGYGVYAQAGTGIGVYAEGDNYSVSAKGPMLLNDAGGLTLQAASVTKGLFYFNSGSIKLEAVSGVNVVLATNGAESLKVTPTGTTVQGAFGCNGKSAQIPYAVQAASATGDYTAALNLCNQIRAALIANGICS